MDLNTELAFQKQQLTAEEQQLAQLQQALAQAQQQVVFRRGAVAQMERLVELQQGESAEAGAPDQPAGDPQAVHP